MTSSPGFPAPTSPDEWIVRGNHEDAWVNGAEDPVSALVDEMEEARSMGELLKQGWKPRRTIIYCVWDGEEAGLARLHGVGRGRTPTNFASTPRFTSTPTPTAAAISMPAARTRWKSS